MPLSCFGYIFTKIKERPYTNPSQGSLVWEAPFFWFHYNKSLSNNKSFVIVIDIIIYNEFDKN